jgi:hypothetical protein
MRVFSYFRIPFLVSSAILASVWVLIGFDAFVLATLLTILEVTLSFDNAVVNAKVLERMSSAWRKRFLTWGILIAVVGTRFIFPILIVAITAQKAPWVILDLVFRDPSAYSQLLLHAEVSIKAFGGMFLTMVALKYFLDEGKTIHWIRVIERRLARLGSIESVEVVLGLLLLLVAALYVAPDVRATVLVAGLVGVVLFLLMEGVTKMLALVSKRTDLSGVSLFIYLNILDAAFSLDGVVGAFALSHDLLIIVVGLGIGAYLVRSMTLYFVSHGTLRTLRYLEHGAHWAIFGLAATMLIGLLGHVPETVSGLIGITFVSAAYYSSVRKIVYF